MAALEEVVLYAFQQCVYYLSKVCAATMLLTVAFPGPRDRRQGTSSFKQGGSNHWFHSGPGCTPFSSPSPYQECHHGTALWSLVMAPFTTLLSDCHVQPVCTCSSHPCFC